jgi:hypothetical protein
MKKLTPRTAQKIQDDILRNMPSEKSIRLTSQLYLLLKGLQDSKVILKHGSRGTAKKHS